MSLPEIHLIGGTRPEAVKLAPVALAMRDAGLVAPVLVASGRATSLRIAAELVCEAVGTSSPIETPGGELPAGENDSYRAAPEAPLPLNLSLEEGIRRYVDWLKNYPAP